MRCPPCQLLPTGDAIAEQGTGGLAERSINALTKESLCLCSPEGWSRHLIKGQLTLQLLLLVLVRWGVQSRQCCKRLQPQRL